MKIDENSLEAALKKLEANHSSRIGHNDRLFLHRIYSGGLEKYRDRLKAIGFSGYNNVLDAGCGYGQWSLPLAEMNRQVSGCDISQLRIDFLNDIVRCLGVTNLEVCVSSIDSLPYPDVHFDAVFCYGVIFLTPWRKSLVEFARVLKPGGKLYLTANGIGWYIFLWKKEYNRANDYDPKMIAAKAFADTLRYDREGIYEPGMNLIIEPRTLRFELRRLGFHKITLASEGSLHLDKTVPPPIPFFKRSYNGQVGVYEAIGVKI